MQLKELDQALRIVTAVLTLQFFLSAIMNLGYKIPLGFTNLSFISPETTIAEFEIAIGMVLIATVAIANLYLFGGSLLLAVVGIAEGLLSADVQGLARGIHESMIPFVAVGWILLAVEGRAAYRTKAERTTGARRHEVVTVLQLFVGGLVTLGGAAFTRGGTYPVGTALGTVHLAIGLTGLYAGYVFLKSRPRSVKFLIMINAITIVYSAFSESFAEIYAYLPRGINDALIGTIIAIVVSGVIICMLSGSRRQLIESKHSFAT